MCLREAEHTLHTKEISLPVLLYIYIYIVFFHAVGLCELMDTVIAIVRIITI